MRVRHTNTHPGLRKQLAQGYRPAVTPAIQRVELVNVLNKIVCMDALVFARSLPDNSVNCVVTSPPYFGLRDYGVEGQIGLENTPDQYIQALVVLFREIRRALCEDGTCWINLGDSYANDGKWGGSSGGKHVKALHGNTSVGRAKKTTGLKPKDLMGIPWRVALALQADGWYLRQDIIWSKPNPMPESVKDRCTKAHEYVFMLTKSPRYWFDGDAIKEPAIENGSVNSFGNKNAESRNVARLTGNMKDGIKYQTKELRNKRSVWEVTTEPTPFAHFATFPTKLIEPMILSGCPSNGVVYDPFMGSGTTALVARELGRNFIGSELNPEYLRIAQGRIDKPYTPPLFTEHTPGESPAPSQTSMFEGVEK